MNSLAGTLRLPTRIHFGYGSRAQLPDVLALHGSRVLAVVDPFLPGTDLFESTMAGLRSAGFEVLVYSDILPELPVASLAVAGDAARDYAPDVILAIGGGSAIDAAKLIGLLAIHDGPLSRYYGENAVPAPTLPLVVIPTTAGTGSEATPVAVVSDPERELKVGISSPYLVPAAAIVDPEFTLGAPASVTAYSGIDALVHTVESYTAASLDLGWEGTLPVFTGSNVLTDLIALEGAARLGRWLPTAVAEPGNRHAREEVALGSLIGGISFGPTGTHLSHALQYPIGALTKTPHGLGTGLMLPYVLQAFRGDAKATTRIAAVGAALGSTASGESERADAAITRIAQINASIGVPATLADIGVTADQLPRIAELALGAARLVSISPVPATRQLLLDILTNALTGTLTSRSTS
jgi:alcohol dehydrogenase